MTPVINPWLFYLMGMSDTLIKITTLILTLLGASLVVYMVTCMVEDEVMFNKRAIKSACVGLLVLIILYITIPTSDTILKMIIAQNITYERIEVTTDVVAQVYEDIISLVDKSEE